MNTITDGTNSYLDGLRLGSGQSQPPANQPQTLGQDAFLKLMVTQLQKQDPVSPVDSTQFFSQLTQFSMVEGLQRMDDVMTQMKFLLQSSQALQASSLVGREVLVKSDVGHLEEGATLSGAVRLPANASEVRVKILDTHGNLVRKLSLGAQPDGLAKLTWDGMTDTGARAEPDAYRIKAEATIDGQTVPLETLARGHVESVALAQGTREMTLTLRGMDPVEMSSVVEIL